MDLFATHFSESISSDVSESEPVDSFPVNTDGNGGRGTTCVVAYTAFLVGRVSRWLFHDHIGTISLSMFNGIFAFF
jgi:hypothetical protein